MTAPPGKSQSIFQSALRAKAELSRRSLNLPPHSPSEDIDLAFPHH